MPIGVGSGVGLAMARAERPAASPVVVQAEQQSLFPAEDAAAHDQSHKGTGRGRPLGSRNRRTAEVADYLRSRYGDPLELIVKRAMMDPRTLAVEAGCDIMEAMQEQRLLAVAALPYIHQRQPVAVDVSNTRTVSLTIVDGVTSPPPSLSATATDLINILDLQGVSDDALV